MTTGIFFNKTVIVNDLNKFAQGMQENMSTADNDIIVGVLEKDIASDFCHMGYYVQANGLEFEVLMPYEISREGEYAIFDNKWQVLHDGKTLEEDYKTLGDVMDAIAEIVNSYFGSKVIRTQAERSHYLKHYKILNSLLSIEKQVVELINENDTEKDKGEVIEKLSKVHEVLLEAEEATCKVGGIK